MANTIQLRRSAVQGAVPTTSQLALGELAINTYDGKLFIKKNDGSESIVEIGAGGGGASVTISSIAPSSPVNGDLWWDSITGQLKIYYSDGSSSQWVDASSNNFGDGNIFNYPNAGIVVSTGSGWDTSITLPSGTLVGTQDTQVLSNKTITTSINAQTGTTYTLAASDTDKLVTLSNASPITVTIPANSSINWSIGNAVKFSQLGAGQVTFTAGVGVTLRSTPGLKCRAQYSGVEAIKIATDEWLIVGDLSA